MKTGFCTDQVHMIELHDIFVPSNTSASDASSTDNSSSNNSTYYSPSSSTSPLSISDKFLEELQLPMEYCDMNNNMLMWDEDYFRSWDLLISDDWDRQVTIDPLMNGEPDNDFGRTIWDLS